MKTTIQALIVAIVLIILFSASRPLGNPFKPPDGFGVQYPGDSGIVIPGDSADIVEAIAQPKADQTETQKPLENSDGMGSKPQTKNEAQTETEMETKTNMGIMMLAFWHGVASVLIGEMAAIMVAMAYLRIKKAGDG